MAHLARFVTEEGTEVLIEVPPAGDMQELAADGKDVITRATARFESAIAAIKAAASAIAKTELPVDKIEMELALKASAGAGFFLASVDSEAQLRVKLSWTRKKTTRDEEG